MTDKSSSPSATLDEAMPREVREAIVRYTASMSGILESFSDQKHVNAALIDVAQVALRCARLATSPSVGPGVEKAIAEGDYASAYGLQIDHEMSQQAETPTAFIGTRYRSGGIVDHHTVELEKWQLHDKGYQESEIAPLYAAPQDIAQEAAASVPSEIACSTKAWSEMDGHERAAYNAGAEAACTPSATRPSFEGRDFYELCQQYRHARHDPVAEYAAIIRYIKTGKLPWPSYEEKTDG